MVKSDVLVQRAGLAFANLEVWNLDDFWEDFSSIYIYILIYFYVFRFILAFGDKQPPYRKLGKKIQAAGFNPIQRLMVRIRSAYTAAGI